MRFDASATHDSANWDAFVSAHPAGHFMQSHAWGEFQRALGWTPHFCTLRDGDTILAAALVLARALPGAFTRVMYAPRGPVLDANDAATSEAFLAGLSQFADSQRAVFVRMDPYWSITDTAIDAPSLRMLHRVPRDWSYWNAPRFVFWLDITGDEAALMKRLSATCRNEVRRGYKTGVTYELAGTEGVDQFHRLMVLTGNQKGIAFHGADYYRRLIETVSPSATVQIFLARTESQVVAAGMSVAYGPRAWLLYAASAPQYYKLRANRTVQWEMIKWAHARGCVRYDFRGTATNDPPRETDPGYGVYEFKRSFGPEFTRLAGYYDLVRRPLLHHGFRVAEEYGLPAAYRVRTWLQGGGKIEATTAPTPSSAGPEQVPHTRPTEAK